MNLQSSSPHCGIPMQRRTPSGCRKSAESFARLSVRKQNLLFGTSAFELLWPVSEAAANDIGGEPWIKKIAGLLGAAAALTTMTAAQAAVAEPTQSAPPASYRDLLEPIPDALNVLKADDARLAAEKRQANEQVAQYYHHHHHHHHHHHGGFGVYIR